jgi:hypothetical protein
MWSNAVSRPELAEGLRPRDRGLAGRAKPGDGVPDLLDLRHPHRHRPEPRDEPGNLFVAGGPVQRIDHVARRRLVAAESLRDRLVRHVLFDGPLEVRLEQDLGREAPLRVRAEERARDDAADREEPEGAQNRE